MKVASGASVAKVAVVSLFVMLTSYPVTSCLCIPRHLLFFLPFPRLLSYPPHFFRHFLHHRFLRPMPLHTSHAYHSFLSSRIPWTSLPAIHLFAPSTSSVASSWASKPRPTTLAPKCRSWPPSWPSKNSPKSTRPSRCAVTFTTRWSTRR